jgi:hypothetical protein
MGKAIERASLFTIFMGIISLIFCGYVWIEIHKPIEQNENPYSEGSHYNYAIICENGFAYKVLDYGRGTIQVLNSDGTPLRCGQKIH